MGNISAVVGGIAGVKDFAVVGGFDTDLAFLDGEKFAGALEMRGAAEGAAGFELNFVEFDIFFEIERGERANPAMSVGAIVIGVVVGANDGDGGGGVGSF